MFSADPAVTEGQQDAANANAPRPQSTMVPAPSAPATTAADLEDFYASEDDGEFQGVFVEGQRSENRRLQDQY
ncbi:hypothetical protein [Alteraurantiacibacter aquimixticola]|uniref:Uncharacterized protein n=1 Tax=Alteraurantiacibacter aquimixticola TaxID=2489173 RepID=A0A4T3F0L0_9SPHN|nr:hypothetical protein [Alteraurantiacibacter aquimixticola]TIX48882.1 hypothetical protein E5222_14165 [Alteraurantiacibacter aquimixticola]